MSKSPSVVRGLIVGVVAGVTATLVMDQFQNLLAAAQKASEKQQRLANGESPWLIANEQAQQEMKQHNTENATDKAARKIAEIAGTTISRRKIKSAGEVVHYTFGTLTGVGYAVAAEFVPEITTGGGTAFATLLFIGGDEVAVPALHLSAPASHQPASSHLQYWAAHIVYGGTLELTRTLLRRFI